MLLKYQTFNLDFTWNKQNISCNKKNMQKYLGNKNNIDMVHRRPLKLWINLHSCIGKV